LKEDVGFTGKLRDDNVKKRKPKRKIKNVLVIERTPIEARRDRETAGFELCRLEAIYNISLKLEKNKKRGLSYIGSLDPRILLLAYVIGIIILLIIVLPYVFTIFKNIPKIPKP